eukprot:5670541-Amphidinium_carterae.1
MGTARVHHRFPLRSGKPAGAQHPNWMDVKSGCLKYVIHSSWDLMLTDLIFPIVQEWMVFCTDGNSSRTDAILL